MSNLIPITIGVIGHRDAVFTLEHKQVINSLLEKLYVLYPNTPLILLSPLAAGADCDVAEVFLEKKSATGRDYQLHVPMPFDKDTYISTFDKQEDVERMAILLGQAEKCYSLETSSQGKDTNQLFRNGGKFVVENTSILIALWDGVFNHKVGGTADLLSYKTKGVFNEEIDESLFDHKVSFLHLPCQRLQSPEQPAPTVPVQAVEDLFKAPGFKSIKTAMDKTEMLNQYAQTRLDPNAIRSTQDYLFPDEHPIDAQNQKLRAIYGLVDSFAQKHQRKYRGLLFGFFLLGFIILIGLEFYKHYGFCFALLVGIGGVITTALSVYKMSHKWKNHNKYLESRVISEALRVQFFWNLADINGCVANHILRIHRTEYLWLRHILSSIYVSTYNTDSTRQASMAQIVKHWITDQQAYFKRKLATIHQYDHAFHRVAWFSFALAMLGLVLIGWYVHHLHMQHHGHGLHDHTLHLIVVIDSIILGFFALTRAYHEKKGYAQIQNQYQLMESIYSSTADNLQELLNDPALNHSQISKLLFLTGKEALVENGNWYLIFKEYEPHLVVGA